ncbi:hypothetical protein DPF13_25345 [Salmonella enterica subsp. diarizonae]|nr:hypothetical protein [Salmonella enterica subsp. diarizonae]EAU1514808.1 hypothetical protein [Salmonella enterica]
MNWVVSEPVFAGMRRPKNAQQSERYQYCIEGGIATSLVQVEAVRARTGAWRSTITLPATYKARKNVKRGFWLLKSPEFLTSSIYLKKLERIEALLPDDLCCPGHRIRNGLEELEIPDMKKKSPRKPTARWSFWVSVEYMSTASLILSLK